MAQNSKRTNSEPLSERARRLEAIEKAEVREASLFGEAVKEYRRSADFNRYRGASENRLIKELLDYEQDAFALVEADRAAFRTATVDLYESEWRLRQFGTWLLTLAVIGSGIAVASAIGMRITYGWQPTTLGLVLLGGIVWFFFSAAARNSPRPLEIFRTRRYAELDARAAENLLYKALLRVAIPACVRQSRERAISLHSQTPSGQDSGASLAIPSPANAPPPIAQDRMRIVQAEMVRLSSKDPVDLVELYQSAQQIPTESRERLKDMVRALGGASIGIAGPRGVGKTTLLQWFFDHQSNEEDHLALRIAAPVRYEPRDFVLTVFAQLCEAVMGGREAEFFPRRENLLGSAWTAVLAVAMVVGGLVLCTTTWTFTASLRDYLGIGLIGTGMSLLLLYLSGAARVAASSDDYLSTNTIRDSSNPDEIAPLLLRDICFQLTFATGYSGKLAAGPAELGVETSYALASRQESFPAVVAKFRAFLEAVANQRGRIYIGIDELDKLQAEEAVRFLDDIKGLFGVPKCFFLLCISEDALSRFERRGLPMRDAFDSAFDEVVRIHPLRPKESAALLRARADFGPGLSSLCHALAGGIPRDVIRYARRLAIISQAEPTIGAAVEELLHQDLQERRAGLELADDSPVEDPASVSSLRCLELIHETILLLVVKGGADLRPLQHEADELGRATREIVSNPSRARSRCEEIKEAAFSNQR